jgi:hypothetical protein
VTKLCKFSLCVSVDGLLWAVFIVAENFCFFFHGKSCLFAKEWIDCIRFFFQKTHLVTLNRTKVGFVRFAPSSTARSLDRSLLFSNVSSLAAAQLRSCGVGKLLVQVSFSFFSTSEQHFLAPPSPRLPP